MSACFFLSRRSCTDAGTAEAGRIVATAGGALSA